MSRVGRHTLIYGAGMMLSRAISFVMLPVYTRYLTPADYGVMELIGTTLDLIAIIAGARIAAGIFRFLVEFVRGNEPQALGLTGPQWVLIPLVGLLVVHFARQLRRDAYRVPSPPVPGGVPA